MTNSNKMILKAEGLAILLGAMYFYNQTGYSWWWFGLFLLFDLSALGYLINKKVGSYTYNLGHSYVLPVILLVLAFENSETLWTVIGLMWVSHVGFDRMQGYGLKEEKGFTHTHLGPIGALQKKKK